MERAVTPWSEGYQAAIRYSDNGCAGPTPVNPYPKDSEKRELWKEGYSTGIEDWYYSRYL
jgi:hypothetical protein